MQYATPEEYKKIYLLGGEQVIPDASFNQFSLRVSQEDIGSFDMASVGLVPPFFIDRLDENGSIVTTDHKYPEYVIMTTCRVAEMRYNEEQATLGGMMLSSESSKIGTSTESRSYTKDSTSTVSVNTQVANVIGRAFFNTPLHNQVSFRGIGKK